LFLLLVNGTTNGFNLTYGMSVVSVLVYLVIIIGLVVFSLVADVKPDAD